MSNPPINNPESVLSEIIESIDVPTSKYKEAEEHYQAVGSWLSAEGSKLAVYDPDVYPQGSFALGTAVRPLKNDDYDVDAVCLLKADYHTITQREVKQLVGDRLKEHAQYSKMLDNEGRRCWTILYADGSKFHLDVLPAIPDSEWHKLLNYGVPEEIALTSIAITDRDQYHEKEWPKSNPKGYKEWFRNRMAASFNLQKRAMAVALKAEVEDIPYYQIQTPLQRVVQILKRHRDIMFNGNSNKPASIIITTLAAWAYDNEYDILTALTNIVANMEQYIENRDGEYWIANPTSPEENFAHRWKKEPTKVTAFFNWLKAVKKLPEQLDQLNNRSQVNDYIQKTFHLPEVATPAEGLAPQIVITESPKPWRKQ